jgi:hypothetical protein
MNSELLQGFFFIFWDITALALGEGVIEQSLTGSVAKK